jgi:hypothetical protein
VPNPTEGKILTLHWKCTRPRAGLFLVERKSFEPVNINDVTAIGLGRVSMLYCGSSLRVGNGSSCGGSLTFGNDTLSFHVGTNKAIVFSQNFLRQHEFLVVMFVPPIPVHDLTTRRLYLWMLYNESPNITVCNDEDDLSYE